MADRVGKVPGRKPEAGARALGRFESCAIRRLGADHVKDVACSGRPPLAEKRCDPRDDVPDIRAVADIPAGVGSNPTRATTPLAPDRPGTRLLPEGEGVRDLWAAPSVAGATDSAAVL
jgi:hypothetical protein